MWETFAVSCSGSHLIEQLFFFFFFPQYLKHMSLATQNPLLAWFKTLCAVKLDLFIWIHVFVFSTEIS